MLEVYTRRNCRYCRMAKDILDDFSIPYTEVDLDRFPNSVATLRRMGIKTLPGLIVSGKELVPGGYKSLRSMRREEILARIEG